MPEADNKRATMNNRFRRNRAFSLQMPNGHFNAHQLTDTTSVSKHASLETLDEQAKSDGLLSSVNEVKKASRKLSIGKNITLHVKVKCFICNHLPDSKYLNRRQCTYVQ